MVHQGTAAGPYPRRMALTDEEKAVLEQWIEAGAPFPVLDKARPYVSEKEILAAVRGHLEKTPAADRPFPPPFSDN